MAFCRCVTVIAVLVLLIGLEVEADYSDQTEEQLLCAQQCFANRRYCARLPDVCGDCISNHVEIYRRCTPKTLAVAESAPDEAVTIDKALERRRKQVQDNRGHADAGMNKQSSVDNYSRYYTYNGSLDRNTALIIVLTTCFGVVGLAVLVIVLFFCCRHCKKKQKEREAAEYWAYRPPAYTQYPTTANDKPPAAVDRKLAESAQMFHYQHQKQQMLEIERAHQVAAKSDDDASTDDEVGDDRLTVYECAGLATTGELEVRNPLYSESPLPPITYTESVNTSAQQHESTAQPLVNGHDEK